MTDSHLLYFIRYTWSSSDERIFFLDKELEPIEKDINIDLFPGLNEFFDQCWSQKDKILSRDNETTLPELLSINETRGPQSFAFGHYLVDILPVLFYLQLFKRSRLSLLPPLLIYSISEWHEDLHKLFGISKEFVFPLNSYPSKLNAKVDKGQEIRLYAANIKLINPNITFLRKCFANNLRIISNREKHSSEIDILFLTRKELGARPLRWTNQDIFKTLLTNSNTIHSSIVDPARILPSQLVTYTKKASIIISPPGSSAYIPLHIAKSNTFVVMPVSFNCDHEDAWKYTLSMFLHYSSKLILISNANTNISPSSKAWDRSFHIDQLHLMSLIERILSITKHLDLIGESTTYKKVNSSSNKSRHIIQFKSLTVSLPTSFNNSIIQVSS